MMDYKVTCLPSQRSESLNFFKEGMCKSYYNSAITILPEKGEFWIIVLIDMLPFHILGFASSQ